VRSCCPKSWAPDVRVRREIQRTSGDTRQTADFKGAGRTYFSPSREFSYISRKKDQNHKSAVCFFHRQ